MTGNDHPTLTQAIGQRLKALREELGLRQDDVATAAREVGLDWVQPTVTMIEAGQRGVSLAEFWLIPLALHRATGGKHFPEPRDLLPKRGYVRLTSQTVADVGSLGLMLFGIEPGREEHIASGFDTPAAPGRRAADEERDREMHERSDQRQARYQQLWPDANTSDLLAAEHAARGGAEQKAAHRLRVPATVLSVAAHARWGRSLTRERDQRVAQQAPPDATARTLQALRGHITRTLVGELAADLTQHQHDQHDEGR